MENNQLARYESPPEEDYPMTERRLFPTPVIEFNAEAIETIRRTVAQGCSDPELTLFLSYCRRTGLDPLARQVYCIKRGGKASIQTSIDGFRLVAERTRLYGGQLGPEWCGPDGKWVDVWLADQPPAAARVGVRRKDFIEVVWSVAVYREYVQFGEGNQPNSMWKKMPAHMLAKCAESLALRKAFPNELSGIYTAEEMGSPEALAAIDPGEPVPAARPLPQAPPRPQAASPATAAPAAAPVDPRRKELVQSCARQYETLTGRPPSGNDENKAAFLDYCLRSAGLKERPAEGWTEIQLAAFLDEMRAVPGLRQRGLGLAKMIGVDPEAEEGVALRAEVGQVLGYIVASRETVTAREWRKWITHCEQVLRERGGAVPDPSKNSPVEGDPFAQE